MKIFVLQFSFILYFIFSLFVIFLTLKGKLTFGAGLGDLAYLAAILCTNIFYFALYFAKEIRKRYFIVIMVSIVLFMSYFIVSLTFLRGSEHLWDGSLFVKWILCCFWVLRSAAVALLRNFHKNILKFFKIADKDWLVFSMCRSSATAAERRDWN